MVVLTLVLETITSKTVPLVLETLFVDGAQTLEVAEEQMATELLHGTTISPVLTSDSWEANPLPSRTISASVTRTATTSRVAHCVPQTNNLPLNRVLGVDRSHHSMENALSLVEMRPALTEPLSLGLRGVSCQRVMLQCSLLF